MSFSTKWPGVNWAFRDSSEVVEAQHTWFTTAYETILFNNNRSAAKWRIEHKIIKYVCERFKKTKNKKTIVSLDSVPRENFSISLFVFKRFEAKKWREWKKRHKNFISFRFFFRRGKKCTPFRCGVHCRLALWPAREKGEFDEGRNPTTTRWDYINSRARA